MAQRTEVEALAGMSVGAALGAALIAMDLPSLTERELLLFLAASARQDAFLDARRIEATSRFVEAGQSRPGRPVGVLGARDSVRMLADELHLSKGAAQYDVFEAQRLTSVLSPLLDGLSEGVLSLRHVRAVSPVLNQPELDEGVMTQLCERVVDFAADHTPAETKAKVVHWLISEDIQSAEARHHAALDACDVTHEVLQDGIGRLSIEGPLHQTLSIHRAITAAAAKDAATADQADPEGPSIGRRRSELAIGVLIDACTPPDQCRFDSETFIASELTGQALRLADYEPVPEFSPQMSTAEVLRTYCEPETFEHPLLASRRSQEARQRELERLDRKAGLFPPDEHPPELTEDELELLYQADPYQPSFIPRQRGKPVTGRFLRHGVKPIQTSLVIDYDTATGLGQNPGKLDGCFPITPGYARVLLQQSDVSVLFRDPKSRTFIDRSPLTYVPSDEQAQYIRSRDPICIAPGCLRPASECQLDHRISFNHDKPQIGGLTVVDEINPLCVNEHQLKTHFGFRIDKDGDGALWWVNPLGMRYPIKAHCYE